ncbi:MAG: hypothetical protein M3Y56_04945 [Armatimonadota bacterium]|nr:hypothetical protein [Armatimonadota bacterium]
MTHTDQTIEDFARRVLLGAIDGKGILPETLADATEHACEDLRRRLANVVGSEGSRAMLARSLVLTKREFPWPDATQVSATGALIGLQKGVSGRERLEVEAGCVALLARFLNLLASLIGEDLTGRLIHGVWPTVPFDESNPNAQEADR